MGSVAPNELQVMLQQLGQLLRVARSCQPNFAHLSLGAKMPRLRNRLMRINQENGSLADELNMYTRQYGRREEETIQAELYPTSNQMDWNEELEVCERGTISLMNAFESVMQHRCLMAFPELYKNLHQHREQASDNLNWLRAMRTA